MCWLNKSELSKATLWKYGSALKSSGRSTLVSLKMLQLQLRKCLSAWIMVSALPCLA